MEKCWRIIKRAGSNNGKQSGKSGKIVKRAYSFITVPCRLNRLFGISLYKIAIFAMLKNYLNEFKNPPFFHQLLIFNMETFSSNFGSKISSNFGVLTYQTFIFHFYVVKWGFFILLTLRACNSTTPEYFPAKTHGKTSHISTNKWSKNGVFSITF